MFELAATMRQDGGGPVYDLSLGNPSLEPPALWRRSVAALVMNENPPGRHRYMTNSGFPEVRAFIAKREATRYGLAIEAQDVTMTVGAAGAVNVFMSAVIDRGEEVITPAPFFAEYEHYCANAGAVLVPVQAGPGFALNVDAVLAVVGPKTRIVMLNSPNNPTGAIYSREALERLAQGLRAVNKGRERPIYVLEDSPYRNLVYDGGHVPSMLECYDQTVFATSHSKDLGLAGERIGYLVASPRVQGRDLLGRALSFCNRTMGFVNAPALMQRALPLVLGHDGGRVDVSVYKANTLRMSAVLRELGFELETPRAGFFLFPRLPKARRRPGDGDEPDEAGDIAMTDLLREHRVVVVPGTAFGVPGYLRLAMCVEPSVVDGAIAAVRAACS